MALISHHQTVRLGTRNLQFPPEVPVQICSYSFTGGAVSHRTHAKMTERGACCSSTPPYPRPSSPSPITVSFASTSAFAAKSCSATAVCPSSAARCSGVLPFCGARQRSGRHPLSLRKTVHPLLHPRPPLYHTSTVPKERDRERERDRKARGEKR